MDVTPLVSKGSKIIQSYAGGRFRISGTIFEGAIIVFPAEVTAWPGVSSFDALNVSDFNLLLPRAADIDVLLLGCGAAMRFMPTDLRAALKAQGLGVDVMDTGAACRTYNVLMAEGRRVAAALLPAAAC